MQFRDITGASESTARHYLEQTQGDLEEGVEQFYANGGKEVAAPAAGGAPAAAVGRQPARSGGAPRRVPSGNIRGFGDLGADEEGEEEEEEEDNEYYAGGAKRCAGLLGTLCCILCSLR